jgi:glutaminyl-peptide cyclotransferase
MGRSTLVPLCAISLALAGCTQQQEAPKHSPAPVQLHAEVLATIPHDRGAFTEGLELAGGQLYEGTGELGTSSVRTVDPATGAVRRKADLPSDLFGEGITVVGPTLWQLTYRNGIAIQRDATTLAEQRRVSYPGEGWGLCHDPTTGRLVMSDGTDKLTFRDPTTFAPVGEVRVSSNGDPVTWLNELECAHGSVFANVWKSDTVVRIDPASGKVTADIDLSGLLPADERDGVDVLNGIAAVPDTDEFLVTGKYWPKMYRVKFVA